MPNKYQKIGTEVVGSDEHLAMSLESSKAGMTLLKKGPLPFGPGKSVAVIGQAVSDMDAMTGNCNDDDAFSICRAFWSR